MSNGSDSDEFFDACETISAQDMAVKGLTETGDNLKEFETHQFSKQKTTATESSVKQQTCSNLRPIQKDKRSRHKFKELRSRMQTEEDEGGISNTSPADSQVSSVEDVFAGGPSGKILHPFRVIEHDALSIQSMTSLGRVGRILSGASDPNDIHEKTLKNETDMELPTPDEEPEVQPSEDQRYRPMYLLGKKVSGSNDVQSQENPQSRILQPLQEPDVIASTKPSNNNHTQKEDRQQSFEPLSAPVAPPRRKRKARNVEQQQNASEQLDSNSSAPSICEGTSVMYSTESTIENLTRELENSLDIKLPTKGNYIANTKDEEKPKSSRHQSFSDRVQTSRNMNEKKSRTIGQCNRGYSLKSSSEMPVARSSSTYPLPSVSSHSVGTRAGLGLRLGVSPQRSKERRKSTGDEQLLPHPLNMFVRTRTESGKELSDMEILEQVSLLNLDTGERFPLSKADAKLPQCINPLSLHIMRLTSEYDLEKRNESDEESTDSKKSYPRTAEEEDQDTIGVVKKTEKLKKFLGSTVRKTVSKAKTIAQEVSHVRHKEDGLDVKEDVNPQQQQTELFKLRASNSHKGPYEFQNLQYLQELGEHAGPVWCMRFSSCGRLLATAGRDRVLRIWVLRNAFTYFQEMRTKYNAAENVSPTPSQESLVSQHSGSDDPSSLSSLEYSDDNSPFAAKPFCTYTGHASDLLDLAWSKNYFVLSSSMDKTVRLWHISRKECLCCFQHIDFVTAICFLPRDDRYFLSGSLDGKLRLWNIPDKKVAVWNEVDGPTKLITAANFCQNGKFAVVGSYDGRCIFYNTDQLRYHTQIHVRSTRGRNARGRKITGIEPMPGEDKILVTSNDSRIRLYDLIDLNLSCKYKGYVNVSSQIKASFSHDGKFIICGSENQCVYIWKTHHDYSKFPSVRRDRNDFWEGVKAHNAVVTCAVFAPNPDAIFQQIEEQNKKGRDTKDVDTQSEDTISHSAGYVFVSADFNGCIRVFLNKVKPKHSSLPSSALT